MKILLIRDVPQDAAKIVADFKEEHSIKVNTDAVLKLIRDFPAIRDSYGELMAKFQALSQSHTRAKALLGRHADNLVSARKLENDITDFFMPTTDPQEKVKANTNVMVHCSACGWTGYKSELVNFVGYLECPKCEEEVEI